MIRALTLFSLLALAACGKGELGYTCKGPDDCIEGLSCLTISTQDIGPDGLECVEEQYCTITCTSDADCTGALGDGTVCIDQCGDSVCFVGG